MLEFVRYKEWKGDLFWQVYKVHVAVHLHLITLDEIPYGGGMVKSACQILSPLSMYELWYKHR